MIGQIEESESDSAAYGINELYRDAIDSLLRSQDGVEDEFRRLTGRVKGVASVAPCVVAEKPAPLPLLKDAEFQETVLKGVELLGNEQARFKADVLKTIDGFQKTLRRMSKAKGGAR